MQVSVIVVSRRRVTALARCLASLAQLDFTDFEIVVICDSATARAVRARPDAHHIKCEVCNVPNISMARNQGIACAAGEILAFIDDDSVAEPTWLDHLLAPFSNPQVTATGGFVRGRNGVSFQWQATSVDPTGQRRARDPEETLSNGEVWHTEGTNMAFRAASVRAIGGFDTAYAFYLDETDVNRRLPGKTVITPAAEVHHGFAESDRRRADRVPRTLFEIGASSAYFVQKHAKETFDRKIDELLRSEKQRLLRHMRDGRLEPRDVTALMDDLRAGLAAGKRRGESLASWGANAAAPFRKYRATAPGPKSLITGPWSRRKQLESQAKQATEAGERPTLVLFSPDTRPLKVRFHTAGYWSHVGGQFGRTEREGPRVRWGRQSARILEEIRRTATIRNLPPETCALHKA